MPHSPGNKILSSQKKSPPKQQWSLIIIVLIVLAIANNLAWSASVIELLLLIKSGEAGPMLRGAARQLMGSPSPSPQAITSQPNNAVVSQLPGGVTSSAPELDDDDLLEFAKIVGGILLGSGGIFGVAKVIAGSVERRRIANESSKFVTRAMILLGFAKCGCRNKDFRVIHQGLKDVEAAIVARLQGHSRKARLLDTQSDDDTTHLVEGFGGGAAKVVVDFLVQHQSEENSPIRKRCLGGWRALREPWGTDYIDKKLMPELAYALDATARGGTPIYTPRTTQVQARHREYYLPGKGLSQKFHDYYDIRKQRLAKLCADSKAPILVMPEQLGQSGFHKHAIVFDYLDETEADVDVKPVPIPVKSEYMFREALIRVGENHLIKQEKKNKVWTIKQKIDAAIHVIDQAKVLVFFHARSEDELKKYGINLVKLARKGKQIICISTNPDGWPSIPGTRRVVFTPLQKEKTIEYLDTMFEIPQNTEALATLTEGVPLKILICYSMIRMYGIGWRDYDTKYKQYLASSDVGVNTMDIFYQTTLALLQQYDPFIYHVLCFAAVVPQYNIPTLYFEDFVAYLKNEFDRKKKPWVQSKVQMPNGKSEYPPSYSHFDEVKQRMLDLHLLFKSPKRKIIREGLLRALHNRVYSVDAMDSELRKYYLLMMTKSITKNSQKLYNDFTRDHGEQVYYHCRGMQPLLDNDTLRWFSERDKLDYVEHLFYKAALYVKVGDHCRAYRIFNQENMLLEPDNVHDRTVEEYFILARFENGKAVCEIALGYLDRAIVSANNANKWLGHLTSDKQASDSVQDLSAKILSNLCEAYLYKGNVQKANEIYRKGKFILVQDGQVELSLLLVHALLNLIIGQTKPVHVLAKKIIGKHANDTRAVCVIRHLEAVGNWIDRESGFMGAVNPDESFRHIIHDYPLDYNTKAVYGMMLMNKSGLDAAKDKITAMSYFEEIISQKKKLGMPFAYYEVTRLMANEAICLLMSKQNAAGEVIPVYGQVTVSSWLIAAWYVGKVYEPESELMYKLHYTWLKHYHADMIKSLPEGNSGPQSDGVGAGGGAQSIAPVVCSKKVVIESEAADIAFALFALHACEIGDHSLAAKAYDCVARAEARAVIAEQYKEKLRVDTIPGYKSDVPSPAEILNNRQALFEHIQAQHLENPVLAEELQPKPSPLYRSWARFSGAQVIPAMSLGESAIIEIREEGDYSHSAHFGGGGAGSNY